MEATNTRSPTLTLLKAIVAPDSRVSVSEPAKQEEVEPPLEVPPPGKPPLQLTTSLLMEPPPIVTVLQITVAVVESVQYAQVAEGLP
jgi:hypothetical protein